MSAIYKSEAGRQAIQARYREILRQWPIPAEQLHVATREGDTFVLASGPQDAPPLVLLHGSGSNSSAWRGDIASWAADFRVYAVDMPGEPGGSAESRPELGSDAIAAWLDDVLAGLGISAASFVGMSLGGWTALDYAVRRPARVTELALYCPGGIGKQRFGWIFKNLLDHLFSNHDLRRSAAIVTGLNLTDHAEILDDVTLTFTHFNPRTGKLPIFTDAQLSSLKMPVLVIVGADDAMFKSAETARRAEQLIPDATIRVLPGVGHAILGQTDSVHEFLRGRHI
ncbi:alpha/beta fold hydrolase [Nocardia seriolae]|uniref:Alpha/beta hydrolase n=1 Tax=Nocardia seriolae TaxID=37332 RepID=A0ABC9YVY7_9NOCA|nr:alpha/beta fold hydrolase [Nocardia seriolae]BEK96995.1 alpha/beta hydrolase [Nocardia seriolae]GAM47753.1 alpha/beta hydrolase [Nocardia seriolae]GAP29638.1 alpha/beta hydrolase [Nocardia seriolae]